MSNRSVLVSGYCSARRSHQNRDGGPGLLGRETVLESCDRRKVVVATVVVPPQLQVLRHPEVYLAADGGAHAGRHDADHGVGLAVEQDRAAQDGGVAIVVALPEAMAEHHAADLGAFFLTGEDASQKRLESQDLEEARAHPK